MPGRRAALLLLGALLAGCATRPAPAPGLWSGRLALRVDSTPPQAFSAGFELSGRPEAGELRLSTALGQTLAVVRWSAGVAQLQRGQEITTRGSLDTLTAELTGAPLPVAALFGWLEGQAGAPAGGWQADLAELSAGRLQARRTEPLPQAHLRLVLDR